MMAFGPAEGSGGGGAGGRRRRRPGELGRLGKGLYEPPPARSASSTVLLLLLLPSRASMSGPSADQIGLAKRSPARKRSSRCCWPAAVWLFGPDGTGGRGRRELLLLLAAWARGGVILGVTTTSRTRASREQRRQEQGATIGGHRRPPIGGSGRSGSGEIPAGSQQPRSLSPRRLSLPLPCDTTTLAPPTRRRPPAAARRSALPSSQPAMDRDGPDGVASSSTVRPSSLCARSHAFARLATGCRKTTAGRGCQARIGLEGAGSLRRPAPRCLWIPRWSP